MDQQAPQELKVVQETTPYPCFASYNVRRVCTYHASTREKYHTRLLVYSRMNNELCLSLQQYPVGDSHNIDTGMRAADGSGDTLGQQEKAPSRGMRYLVNITNKFHVATRNTSSPTRTHTL